MILKNGQAIHLLHMYSFARELCYLQLENHIALYTLYGAK
jgi:hypothetical protein